MSTISESTRPGTDTTLAKHDLPFASVAIAQYHKIQEKLASNNIFCILRSPAPIRVWVYRSLLAENRLWNECDRPAVSATMDKDKDKESRDDGSIDDTESLRDSEADSVNGARARPHLTRLRLALAPYCVHFNNPGYIRDDTLRMLERDVVKKTLEETRKSLEMREELGLSWEFWDSLAEVLKVAIPSLERRCFAAPDPAAPEYEGLSGPLIASYSPSLLRDLERLNQLVCIARNVQVHGDKVQNLSAERLFDKDIFALINVCVRVTARGYDGEAGTQDEDKWQGVINAYKKLLITCLQFLNNLIARNEQRKLMLWIELFDSHLDNELPNFADMKYKLDEFNQQEPTWQPDTPDPMARPSRSLETFKIPQQPASSPFLLYIGETGNDVKKALQQHGVKAGANEIAAECRRRWQTMSEEEKNKWNMLYADVVARYRDQITQSSTYKKVVDQHAKNEESVQALAKSINQLQVEVDRMRSSISTSPESTSHEQASPAAEAKQPARPAPDDSLLDPSIKPSSPAGEIDFRVTYPPSFGAEILQNGKEDLLKRLEPDPDRPSGLISHVASPTSPLPEDDDDNDDDYDDIPGDEGRGLLTDVPLILGPTEIEVLPMIIMAGIVEPQEGQPGYHSDPTVFSSVRSMHGVRCHLLLAQDNGRNLLRELLIFVAAWDLREEELYFKFMVKIMEAILANQLLPFAYHAFRESESKDIISPAQAVIMKLLTNIFRARQARAQPTKGLIRPNPPQVDQGDVHMVNFLLTEFRRHIIPQTCALIFLQGQIRAGHAHAEDFPLNLWDMERMYEGVYQYLEFFAILTEHETWKRMLSNWEIANELVTLLKELDAAIPKGNLSVPPLKNTNQPAPPPPQQQQEEEPQFEQGNASVQHPQPQTPQPVAVERPYDTTAAAAEPYIPPPTSPSPRPYMDEAADEPSDFEWRNLKKLAVLVLSSLVWKNKHVQDQIRPLGGIEAVLNCCSYDEHNPYIREHAIMCLRFLMEGNKENQDRIRALEKHTQEKSSQSQSKASSSESVRPVNVRVPDEVLDQQGYETYMDNKGQVMLRKRQPPQTQTPVQKGKAKANFDPAMRDPKALEDLVQQVMRDLPRVQGLGGERASEAEEALKKLDRGFDGGGKG
ncbi:copper transporter [Parastagonospora nodorum]|nr:copper transporter [Parastagonospora nodorum]KAH4090762.1 copper transporter [Parastagonospora nodorum]KAH6097498.1 copper transporter [Parastagonospora nodorum]KAH6131285.1 copper transporter [Parastagonospora nodorum]